MIEEPVIEAVEMPNLIIPKPFTFDIHTDAISKIQDECLDKIKQCDKSLSSFYGEYEELCGMWRVQKNKRSGKPDGLFNSRVGEIHSATETLTTFIYRALTSAEPFWEAVAEGLNWGGRELTSEDLYVVEQIISKQFQVTDFRRKLVRALRSGILFGTAIVEEPWIQKPTTGRKVIEATDFVLSPLIKTFFDPTVYDIELSDFISTVDFVTNSRLRGLSKNDSEMWDQKAIERVIEASVPSASKETDALSRIRTRKSRAGYQDEDNQLRELLAYHGRVDPNNSLISDIWERWGDPEQDPYCTDFSFRFADGEMCCAYPTQYGDWRTRFKVAHFKQFELEPLGYGMKIGRKAQNEMDYTTSKIKDMMARELYNMWVASTLAGLKDKQLGYRPNGVVIVEDTEGFKPLKHDTNAMAMALNILAQDRTEFRSTVGAKESLQAILTKASATESGIANTESVRSASVHAELIAEPFIRSHIDTCHWNNLNLLDTDIKIAMRGEKALRFGSYNRTNIPDSVGFKVKVTTDKDFRPERLNKLLQGVQIFSSVRQFIPTEMNVNAIKYLSREIFRAMNINPALLDNPITVQEQLELQMQKQQLMGRGGGEIGNENESMANGMGANLENPPQSEGIPLMEGM